MLSFGYLFICAFLTVAVAQQKCAPGWITGPSSCYLLTDEHAFFVDGPEYYFSEIYCNDRYSHGAEIASKEENDFLKSWLSTAINDSTEIVRVGGKDWLGKNRWKWDHSDEKFGFSDWADNPGSSGDCLNLSPKFGFSWVPEDCDKTENLKFICEQELCKQPMECFQGSCYTLHCSLHEAKSSGVQITRDLDDPPAQIFCPQGSLARIESKEEDEFIMKFLSKSEGFVQTVWTAGYQDGIEWKWQGTNETTITGYTNWASAPPSFRRDWKMLPYVGCIALSREYNWAWRDDYCYEQYPVLCEEPDPSSSG